MDLLLILAIIILPMSLGLIFLLLSQRVSSSIATLLSIINMLAMIFSALTASFSGYAPHLCFSWIPSAGELCLMFEKSLLLLVLLVSISLLLMIVIHHNQIIVITSQHLGLTLISISAVNIAFLSEHFLLRYIALEVVGLCVVGVSLSLSGSIKKAWNNTRFIFLNFRLGDIGLMAAISLFYAYSSTFNINQNFSLAAQLPLTIRAVLTFGLLSAAWIKMAICPLDYWADLCSSFPPIMRTWFVDLLMPFLGAYLLYRTSPLLLSSSNISRWIIFIGCVAAIINELFKSTRNQNEPLNRTQLTFSSICLVVLACLSKQNILWGYMIFWMLTRILYLLVSLRQELRSVPWKTKHQPLHLASQLFLLEFSFFAMWQASLPGSVHPILHAVLWTTWWMQFIRTLNLNFSMMNVGQEKARKEKFKKFLPIALESLILAGIFGVFMTTTINFLSLFVKGKVFWIIPDRVYFPYFPLFSFIFWFSLGLSIFIIYFLENTPSVIMKHAKIFIDSIGLRKGLFTTKENGSITDPFDVTPSKSSFLLSTGRFVYKTFEFSSTSYISKFLMTIFTFIYKNIEHGSVDKLIMGIQIVFSFLFNKVEKFTSIDLWINTMRSVAGSSREVQRMHPGFLRINLVLLFLFIVILVLITVVINIGSIYSVG